MLPKGSMSSLCESEKENIKLHVTTMERIQRNEKHVQKIIIADMRQLGWTVGNMLRDTIRLSAFIKRKRSLPLKIT